MVDISQDALPNALSFHGTWIQIPLSSISKDPVDDRSTIVQVMTWFWADNRPLAQPMLAQVTETYISPGLTDLNQLWTVICLVNKKL